MPLSVAERFISELAEKKGACDEEIVRVRIASAQIRRLLRADDASAWSEEVTRAVRHSSSTSSTTPSSALGRGRLDVGRWRWLKQSELPATARRRLGTDASASADWSSESLAAANSPWRRLTERGLRWRVEGCPQVCAAAFVCSRRAPRAPGLFRPRRVAPRAVHLRRHRRCLSRQIRGHQTRETGRLDTHQDDTEPLAAEGTTVAVSDDALIDEVSAGNFSVAERDGKS